MFTPYIYIDSVDGEKVVYDFHFSETEHVTGVAMAGDVIDMDTGLVREEVDED